MSELRTLLQQYINNPKKIVNSKDYMGNNGYIKEKYSPEKPMTYDDIKIYRPVNNQESSFKHIPSNLYNKRIKVGEFELIVQHKHEFIPKEDNDTREINSSKYKTQYFSFEIICNVILVYRGVYQRIAKYSDSIGYEVAYAYPDQTNWHWLTFTPENPYLLREATSYRRFEEYDGTEDIINAISSDFLMEESTIDFQPWYSYDFDKNYKPLIKYTAKNIDTDWFIESEVKDGVYKPEPNTVKNIISSYGEYFDKNLLVKHKVHTIQLRTTAHFDVARTFNIPKGCKINASKVIITLYGYEKFCGDDKMISEIKKEKSKEIAKAKSIIENNKFTLMKNGKVIINNKDKYEIISYLEKFTAKDVDTKILDDIKPIFDNFDIEKFYICYWGVYDKYEMRGHKCDLNFETNGLNNEVIDSDILEQIYSLYEDSIPYLDEREISLTYGTPDMGLQVLGVLKNKRGKLETFIEDYDLL